jgi:ribosomal protein S18 acetylase RimI-like enzyme
MTPSAAIREGRIEDAEVLAGFARRMFEEAFGALNDPGQLANHLAQSFGREHQARELADASWTTLLAEHDGHLVAYAQLRAAAAPGCVHGAEPVELVRFYVDGAWQGQGLAHALMDDALAAAATRGAQTVWLSVWQVNARAVAFYRRRGFRITGVRTFHVGDDPQTDWVMARSNREHP